SADAPASTWPAATPTPDRVVMRLATAAGQPRATPPSPRPTRQPRQQYGVLAIIAGLLFLMGSYVVLVRRQRAARRAGIVLGEERE
ncbi:MAG: hypothetical protein V1772_01605, partial [Chloroflexota bacterium]